MTKKELTEKRKALDLRAKEANRELVRIRAERQVLYTYCDHENQFKTCTMGDTGTHCPDCGYST